MNQKLLLLEFDESLRPAGGTLFVCSVAGPLSIATKEPAGFCFHNAVLRRLGLIDLSPEDDGEDSEKGDAASHIPRSASANDMEQPPPGVSWKGSKSKNKKDVKKKGTDLYALLGLKHERFTATPKQLKDSYRKVCLEYHPDKRLVGVEDEEERAKIEEYFKQIQDAYATLSDPAKRREYDSIDEFDDTLPQDCASADFFKVFGPAFRRNARWSVESSGPVPDLGDENSTYEEANKFYDFWFSFKSWREFPHPDEEDIEGAEGREHRRWIERNNAKLREKAKKEDQRRIKEFVENAYRIDPRVVRRKEEERQERERKKQEKEDAKRRVIEEAERKKAEEEEAKRCAAEEEKRKQEEAKKLREAAKKAMKKERQRLRAINEGAGGSERLLDDDDLEKLTSKMELEGMQELCNSLSVFGISREEQRDLALKQVEQLMTSEEKEIRAKEQYKKAQEAAAREAARVEHQRKLDALREWSDEEVRMLDKAVAKFPQGTPKRWEQVTAYIRTRTLEEVLLMVKEKQGMSASRMRQQEDFKSGQKKRAEVNSQADLRINAFTDVEVNLVGVAAEVLIGSASEADTASATETNNKAEATGREHFSSGAHNTLEAGDGEATVAVATVPLSLQTSKATANVAAAGVNSNGSSQMPCESPTGKGPANDSQAAPAPSSPLSAKAAAAAIADSGEWSEEQSQALLGALKQFGKEQDDRWTHVASIVPGKTKAQCFKRFKEMREEFRNKKGGVAAE